MQPSKRMNLVHVIRFRLRRIPPIPQTVPWICREWSHKWWLRNFRPPHSVRFALGNLSGKATFLQTFPATDCVKLNFQLSKNSFRAWVNSKTNHQLNFNLQKKTYEESLTNQPTNLPTSTNLPNGRTAPDPGHGSACSAPLLGWASPNDSTPRHPPRGIQV